MFSMLIPYYNNLEYLKTCINSLKKNSKNTHQIIVRINEDADGSLEYVKEKNFKYTYSENNIGMAKTLNKYSELGKFDFILITNDDFYLNNKKISKSGEFVKWCSQKLKKLSSKQINTLKELGDFSTIDDSYNKIKFRKIF